MTAIFNFLMIAGAVQGFIFNVATFFSRKKIEKPILFLNLLVFFLSLNNLQSWFIEKRFIDSEFLLHDFTVPWYVLILPMFYAFLVYYLEIEEKRLPFIKTSLLIFFLELVARSSVVYWVNNESWPAENLRIYNNVEDTITLLYSLFLFHKAIQIVFKRRPFDIPVLAFDDLRWLRWFFYLGAGVFILWIMSIVFNTTGIVQKPYSYYPLRLGSSILIYWVGYQAFFRYVVLKDRILLRKKIRTSTTSKRDNRSDKQGKGEEVFNEINSYVITNQKFLDPYLSLESLSEDLDMSSSSLSKLMNSYTGSNFSDYINKFRIEEANKLLGDSNFSEYTIVAIGLECGFNSKSTFYSAFKKFTGLTPTVYRNRRSS